MLVDKLENDDAGRGGPSGSDPGDTRSTPPTSSKLRDKLQKLAKWRIDHSLIEFEEDASEFHGGHATVSRAFLVSTSGNEDNADNAASAGPKNESEDRASMRKNVAVKQLKIENRKDKERVLGLALREAKVLTELSHENVIKLEGFVEDMSEDRVWLVFPWAANGNLKDFVASADWEIPERIWLIDDVTTGVEYLHSRDPPIYHGDLKSVNILVSSSYRAVITDFGSARRLAKKDPTAAAYKSENGTQPALLLETKFCEATNTVTLTGNQYTLRWAAPELLMDDEPGLWSDIWALGWIFYEVMTNAIPFQDVQKDSVVVIRVVQGNLPSVADHTRMVLIRAFYLLMVKCWSLNPSERPTAEDCRKPMSWMPMTIPDPQRASNTSRSAELLVQLGEMYQHQDDYIKASKFYTEALKIYTDTANQAGKAEALLGLADVHRVQGEYKKAAPLFLEVVQIWTDAGNTNERARALLGLADVHRLNSEYNEAAKFYSEAVQICTENRMRAYILWGIAEVHRFRKQYRMAAQLFSEALQIHIDVGDRGGVASTLMSLADVQRDQDQHEDAVRLYEQAARIFEEVGENVSVAYALNCAARSRKQLKPAR